MSYAEVFISLYSSLAPETLGPEERNLDAQNWCDIISNKGHNEVRFGNSKQLDIDNFPVFNSLHVHKCAREPAMNQKLKNK